ncbi:hypothetical protein DAPPUDRAFT_99798 [Daphnia pulex]|uniref:Uncharacterized protein n=1 Tax=Daphnia pulex TaxID=6669 RepID=E9G8B6_DAPPU|nr:hypothetical protein DAPPUDRAFT_99798 [Daphnia pulex]|eukprot:EFX83949.1 hypothetical protein DAPPUDRAFT_99798 [Daphnia pulex]
MFRYGLLLLIACSVAAIAAEEWNVEDRQLACAGTLVTNADGTRSCVTQIGVSSTGYPIYKVTNQNTGVTTYVTQTGVSPTGQPIFNTSNTYPMTNYVNTCTGTLVTNLNTGVTSYVTQTGVNASGQPVYSVTPTYPASTTTAATTCAGTTVTNSDGTRSCVTQVGTSNTGYPINQVTNLNTGATNYVQQTGVSPTNQPTYCKPATYPVNTNYACAGTTVTNSDGTKSCVTQVGTSTSGYPISQVTNLNTGVTSYVEQTGISSTGQPTYSVTPYFPTNSLATTLAPATTTAAPLTTAVPVTTAAPVPNPFVY